MTKSNKEVKEMKKERRGKEELTGEVIKWLYKDVDWKLKRAFDLMLMYGDGKIKIERK